MSTEVERGRGLDAEGIRADRVRWNLATAALYEEAIRRKEGVIAATGPLVCRTGLHTGRSPNDKFVVREPSSEAMSLRCTTCFCPLVSRISTEVCVSVSNRPEYVSPSLVVAVHMR